MYDICINSLSKVHQWVARAPLHRQKCQKLTKILQQTDWQVVTGANKGIELEICRRLAANGVIVVLTAQDEKKGVEAIEKLKGSGLSDVVFHQLDVTDPASIASFADFIKTQFGKLVSLVNNAAINVTTIDDDAYRVVMAVDGPPEVRGAKYRELTRETHEMAEECAKANYYDTKRVTKALLPLLPLLQLSDSPRIVNVSSSAGKL
ncbi:salutaridine reductase-like [Macadamia integrifolia]|uniref:salutaridine reductase-like n=1 Tax=Macadamia integrifolia TaxID=60698 RepID=UPI001C4FE094|nr:salutaridine reductase-like [Macadamia integrifolia]